MRPFRTAVAFLTIVPVGSRLEQAPLGEGAAWFPVVGALVGGVAGGVGYLAAAALGASVAAVLAVAVLVVLTGALHQDGLADCADGLGAARRSRRLEIMRDSAIGTFGALALIVWALLLISALAGLDREHAFRALVVAAATGRWAALVHGALAAPARPDGLGAGFGVSRLALAQATVLAAAAALGLVGIDRGAASLAAAAAAAALVTLWSQRALGGRTGDTLGATVVIAELAVVLTLLGMAARS